MAYDYTQQKTPIFTDVNDQPDPATSSGGSNASDLIAKVNQTLEWLNQDFSSLSGLELWDESTIIYLDTVNGDDTNDGLTNTTPLATWGAVLSLLATKAVITIQLQQLDANPITVDFLDFSAVTFLSKFIPNSSDIGGNFSNSRNILTLEGFNFDLVSATYEEDIIKLGSYINNFSFKFNSCNLFFDQVYSISPSANYIFTSTTLRIGANNSYVFFNISSNILSGTYKFAFQSCTFDDQANGASDIIGGYPSGTPNIEVSISGATVIGFYNFLSPVGDYKVYLSGSSSSYDFSQAQSSLTIFNLFQFGGKTAYVFSGNEATSLLPPERVNEIGIVFIEYNNPNTLYNIQPSRLKSSELYLGDIQIRNYKLLVRANSEFRLYYINIFTESGDFTFDVILNGTAVATNLSSIDFDGQNFQMGTIGDSQSGANNDYLRIPRTNDLSFNVTANNTAINCTIQLEYAYFYR